MHAMSLELVRILTGVVFSQPLTTSFATPHDFTIYLPQGWVQIPEEVIDSNFATIHAANPGIPREQFDYGFQAGSASWFTFPYVLIQVRNTGKLPEPPKSEFLACREEYLGDMARTYNQIFDQNFDSLKPSFVETASLDCNLIDWDLDHHVIWFAVRYQTRGADPTVGVMAIRCTEKGIMRVGCAMLESQFASVFPTFKSIVNSMWLGPTMDYRTEARGQTERASPVRKAFERMLETAGPIAVLCLIAFLISMGRYLLSRKRRGAPEEEKTDG